MTPFNPSTLQPLNPSMRTDPRGGTVLMEAVLCLPLLLFLVTGIVQFARIWEARLLTRHAAYNAARAALVYNVEDYATVNGSSGSIRFKRQDGPVWLAAVNTLVWKSATFSASEGRSADYLFPGFSDRPGQTSPSYRVPNSAFVQDQVSIVPSLSGDSNGLVRVTVQFKFPLLFSLFALGAAQNDPDLDLPFGDTDDAVPLVHDAGDDIAPRDAWHDSIPHIRLRETCLLPKPWSTRHYPKISDEELAYMTEVAP